MLKHLDKISLKEFDALLQNYIYESLQLWREKCACKCFEIFRMREKVRTASCLAKVDWITLVPSLYTPLTIFFKQSNDNRKFSAKFTEENNRQKNLCKLLRNVWRPSKMTESFHKPHRSLGKFRRKREKISQNVAQSRNMFCRK